MTDVVHFMLGRLRDRDRQVIERFYFEDESPEEICRALNLTENQYRLIKSRAKARVGDLCRRRLAGRAGRPEAVRRSVA